MRADGWTCEFHPVSFMVQRHVRAYGNDGVLKWLPPVNSGNSFPILIWGNWWPTKDGTSIFRPLHQFACMADDPPLSYYPLCHSSAGIPEDIIALM